MKKLIMSVCVLNVFLSIEEADCMRAARKQAREEGRLNVTETGSQPLRDPAAPPAGGAPLALGGPAAAAHTALPAPAAVPDDAARAAADARAQAEAARIAGLRQEANTKISDLRRSFGSAATRIQELQKVLDEELAAVKAGTSEGAPNCDGNIDEMRSAIGTVQRDTGAAQEFSKTLPADLSHDLEAALVNAAIKITEWQGTLQQAEAVRETMHRMIATSKELNDRLNGNLEAAQRLTGEYNGIVQALDYPDKQTEQDLIAWKARLPLILEEITKLHDFLSSVADASVDSVTLERMGRRKNTIAGIAQYDKLITIIEAELARRV